MDYAILEEYHKWYRMFWVGPGQESRAIFVWCKICGEEWARLYENFSLTDEEELYSHKMMDHTLEEWQEIGLYGEDTKSAEENAG